MDHQCCPTDQLRESRANAHLMIYTVQHITYVINIIAMHLGVDKIAAFIHTLT